MTREEAIEIFEQYQRDIKPFSMSKLTQAVQIALDDMKEAQLREQGGRP